MHEGADSVLDYAKIGFLVVIDFLVDTFIKGYIDSVIATVGRGGFVDQLARFSENIPPAVSLKFREYKHAYR